MIRTARFGAMLALLALIGPAPLLAHPLALSSAGGSIGASSAQVAFTFDRATGRWSAAWKGGGTLRNAFCEASLGDATVLRSTDCLEHWCDPADHRPFHDRLGSGIELIVHHRAAGRPELRQRWRLYRDLPFLLTRTDIVSDHPVASNQVAPLVISVDRVPGSTLHLEMRGRPRTLFIPFDNDAWVRYNSDYASESCEATAIYDNDTRRGFVVGSVSHDLWKTRLTMNGLADQGVGEFRADGGGAGDQTHDTQPHGLVKGATIQSPWLFVGFFADWRDGLECYGRANARLSPRLPWKGPVPFGWNSWVAYGDHVDDRHVRAVSDYLRDHLQPAGFGNRGDVYVNLDSYWDNIPEPRLIALVRQIHGSGQRAGIYWAPFVDWGDDASRLVEGTDGRYRYADIRLIDAAGHFLPKLDGGWPVDPTHPGALQRIDWQIQRFVRWGFDFVKLDFLTHGALEGDHADPRVPTGLAAYRVGMERIVRDLAPGRTGRRIFLSLSIAPLFPSGYGHARRISCDAAGSIHDSEYVLNSLTYGWWINDTLYRFNDPDMVALNASEAEARTRVNSAVIAGTVLLDSDDLTQPGLQSRARALLTNRAILTIARRGRAFRPVEGDTGPRAANWFLSDEGAGRLLLAAFNFGDSATSLTVDLPRLVPHPHTAYRVADLWTGRRWAATARVSLTLGPRESTLLRLEPVTEDR